MLAWWAQHAKHIKSYEEYEKNGRRMEVLDRQPVVFPGNEYLFDAFMVLDTCRQVGMAQGPIPWTACDQYAARLGMADEEAAILWAVIHKADSAYRAELAKLDGG